MLEAFSTTFLKILTMCLFIFVGYFSSRTIIDHNKSSKVFSFIAKNIVLPVYTFYTLATSFTKENISSNSRLLMIGTVLVIFAALIGFLFAFLLARNEKYKGLYWYIFTIANYGFFGYPLVEQVFGEQVKAMMVTMAIPLMVFNYSIAVTAIGIGSTQKAKRKFSIPWNLVAVILGIIVGLTTSSNFKDALSFLKPISCCLSPISMVLIGLSLGALPLSKIFVNKKSYLISFIRLILIPGIFFGIAYRAGMRGYELLLITILTCMPVGMNTIVFFSGKDEDRYIGAQHCIISMIFSLITIPMFIAIVTLLM